MGNGIFGLSWKQLAVIAAMIVFVPVIFSKLKGKSSGTTSA